MLLRRVIMHVKAQNWTAVCIDFVIVVVGILIALQITNWNEAIRDRAAERQYLTRLLGDLDAATAEVEEKRSFEIEASAVTGKALKLIGEHPSERRRQELAAALSFLSFRRTLVINSPTFRELQSTGQLSLIRNKDVRETILSYFGRAQRLERVFDKNAEQFVDYGFAAFLRKAGIDFRRWDPKLGPTPEFWVELQEHLEINEHQLDGLFVKSSSPVLMSGPDAAIWEELRVQLSWRAMIAANDESMADEFAALTSETRNEIAAYLEELK